MGYMWRKRIIIDIFLAELSLLDAINLDIKYFPLHYIIQLIHFSFIHWYLLHNTWKHQDIIAVKILNKKILSLLCLHVMKINMILDFFTMVQQKFLYIFYHFIVLAKNSSNALRGISWTLKELGEAHSRIEVLTNRLCFYNNKKYTY